MTGKDGSADWRSSARLTSRCCHGPISPGPTHTATARQARKTCSSACGQGRPGTRYQRSRKTERSLSRSERASVSTRS